MFIDRTCIRVKGGNGGNGCNSAHKLPGNRYKKPDGGNGGNGGNVYLLCDKNLATLLDFYYKKNFSAFSGKHGGSFRKKGKDGEDLYIKVPPGTVVKDFLSGKQICDLCSDGQFILTAKGGKGGWRNYKADKAKGSWRNYNSGFYRHEQKRTC